MAVRQDKPGILFYKVDFDGDFLEINLNRKSRRNIIIPNNLEPIMKNGPKPISKKKYDHLQKLLPWVPKAFHNFYISLAYDGRNEDEEC